MSCIFCQIAAAERESDCVVFQDDWVIAVPSLHQRPQNQGHLQVASVAHVENIYEVPDELGAHLFAACRAMARTLKSVFHADGITIHQMNEAPFQKIGHLHFHVVPRFVGDLYWESVGIHEEEFLVSPQDLRARQAVLLRRALALEPVFASRRT